MVKVELAGSALGKNERGLVICKQIDTKVYDRRPVDPSVLRMMALFFDRIDLPTNLTDYVSRSADEKFLIDTGVLVRSLRHHGAGLPYAQGHYDGFDILQNRELIEPGRWAIASRSGGRPSVRPEALSQSRALMIELFDALPIPEKDVHLEDCLRFKVRYTAELWALRAALGEAYLKIQASEDVHFALENEVTRIRSGINDYFAAMQFSGIKFQPINFAFDISLAGTMATLLTSETITKAMPPEQIVVGGALVKLANCFSLKTPPTSPYSYLWSMRSRV